MNGRSFSVSQEEPSQSFLGGNSIALTALSVSSASLNHLDDFLECLPEQRCLLQVLISRKCFESERIIIDFQEVLWGNKAGTGKDRTSLLNKRFL